MLRIWHVIAVPHFTSLNVIRHFLPHYEAVCRAVVQNDRKPAAPVFPRGIDESECKVQSIAAEDIVRGSVIERNPYRTRNPDKGIKFQAVPSCDLIIKEIKRE